MDEGETEDFKGLGWCKSGKSRHNKLSDEIQTELVCKVPKTVPVRKRPFNSVPIVVAAQNRS